MINLELDFDEGILLQSKEINFYGELGSNLINTEDYLSIDVHEMSKDAYKKYVNGCCEKGFTVKLSEYNGYTWIFGYV